MTVIWAGRRQAVGLFYFHPEENVDMTLFRSATAILALLCILLVGCGGSTGKDIYKDKDKPKPTEKEK